MSLTDVPDTARNPQRADVVVHDVTHGFQQPGRLRF